MEIKKKVILMSFFIYYCLYKTNLLLVNLNRYIYKRKADFVHISLKFRKIIGSLVAVLILMWLVAPNCLFKCKIRLFVLQLGFGFYRIVKWTIIVLSLWISFYAYNFLRFSLTIFTFVIRCKSYLYFQCNQKFVVTALDWCFQWRFFLFVEKKYYRQNC